MNLAVIRKECTFRKGGAERYAANLCRALAQRGHKVWVLAEHCDPDLHPGIIHVPVRVNRTTSSSRNTSFHQNSQEALTRLQPDAVLALSRTYPSDAFRVSDPLHEFWMRIRYPNPVNRFLQKLNSRHRTLLDLERAILDPANTRSIITNSELSKKIITETSAYPPERIHVVYNGVDHDQFSPGSGVPRDEDAIRLLFVGQDFKRKGLGPLLQALALVKRSGVHCRLRVIGRDRVAPFKKLAKQLGIDDIIGFGGATQAIEEAYRRADLLVFPTLYDPFANVCLEALACGLPVLTTSTNGSSEVISEGEDGYVVDGQADGLPDRLAEKVMRHFKLGPEARRKMKEAAVQKASKFTVEGNARAVVAVLEEARTRRR